MTYVALLRGVTPSNPKMRNKNLRLVCEELGFRNVQTVISSGNVVFDSDINDHGELETTLEQAWQEKLGFESMTIVRSDDQLSDLVDAQPFGDLEHSRETYLLVTFAKVPLDIGFEFPHQPEGRPYRLVGATDTELFTVSDTTVGSSLDLMAWLDTEFDKRVSSRTWLTVHRILKKMDR